MEKRLNIRITEEELEMLRELAEKDNRTMAGYVKNLIKINYKNEGEKEMKLEEKREQKMGIVQKLTDEKMNQLEKKHGITFTREQRQSAVRSHQDSLSDEEFNMDNDKFSELIQGWLDDQEDNFLE